MPHYQFFLKRKFSSKRGAWPTAYRRETGKSTWDDYSTIQNYVVNTYCKNWFPWQYLGRKSTIVQYTVYNICSAVHLQYCTYKSHWQLRILYKLGVSGNFRFHSKLQVSEDCKTWSLYCDWKYWNFNLVSINKLFPRFQI